jgi:hypothetical protein
MTSETGIQQDFADGYRDGWFSLELLPNPSLIYTRAFLKAIRVQLANQII